MFKPNITIPESSEKKLVPTSEQEKIIQAAKNGKNIAIKAMAGAAKTSTCIMIANEVVKPSLYLAFNKSIADEAGGKFPSHVTCQTINSLAWRKIVRSSKSRFGKKLQGFFDFDDISIPLFGGYAEEEIKTKIEICKIVTEFCQSSAFSFAEFLETYPDDYIQQHSVLFPFAEQFWKDVSSETSPAKMTHDVYLKLFQLSRPVLIDFDLIYVDEFQDSNPVTIDLVLRQTHAQIIVVGDPFQSIYEFRGAINGFEEIQKYRRKFEEMFLTESFRFTQEIADFAFAITRISGNDRKIIGKAEKQECKNQAILVRNNATMLSYLLQAIRDGKKVKVLADLKDLWSKMYHISDLSRGQKPKFPNRELSVYKSFRLLEEAGEFLPEIKKLISLYYTLSAGGLHKNIQDIKAIIVDGEEEYDFVISTIWKAKGLEWDEVTLAEDTCFLKEGDTLEEFMLRDQNANSLYVALTRAKYMVNLPELVKELL